MMKDDCAILALPDEYRTSGPTMILEQSLEEAAEQMLGTYLLPVTDHHLKTALVF